MATIEAALKVQERLQAATAEYQKLQAELAAAVEARQKLDAQLSENELVKKAGRGSAFLNALVLNACSVYVGVRVADREQYGVQARGPGACPAGSGRGEGQCGQAVGLYQERHVRASCYTCLLNR